MDLVFVSGISQSGDNAVSHVEMEYREGMSLFPPIVHQTVRGTHQKQRGNVTPPRTPVPALNHRSELGNVLAIGLGVAGLTALSHAAKEIRQEQ